MQTIYFELPDTYREMLVPLEQFSGLEYIQIHETIDRYIELLVRLEMYRRWCNTDTLKLREWFKATIADDPVSSDYFTNQVIQTYITQSRDVWRNVSRELTFTPSGQFMMWHIDRGLWKMITSGVDFYVE